MAAPDFGGLLARAKSPGGMATPSIPGLKATPKVPPVEGTEDGMTVRLTPIAQDVIDAIRGGDATALADALMAAHSAIAAGPSEAESELE